MPDPELGVYELRAGMPDPEALLAAVAEAGYAGVDLGPPGYLGEGDTLAKRLARRGLAIAGAWVQVGIDGEVGHVGRTLDALEAGGDAARPPVPTLAVDGPGGPLPQGEWARLIEVVRRAASLCRARGLEPAFHPHLGTWIETAAQAERLLDETDLALCLDTGHLLLAGGDPVAILERRRGRVTHVHLKDARLADGGFCGLGAGDVDLDGVLNALGGYDGWLVVEQDREPGSPLDGAAAGEARNRAYLRGRGL